VLSNVLAPLLPSFQQQQPQPQQEEQGQNQGQNQGSQRGGWRGGRRGRGGTYRGTRAGKNKQNQQQQAARSIEERAPSPAPSFVFGKIASPLIVNPATCQGGPRWSPEVQSTLVWSSCWGATGGAGRSTQRGEQRKVMRTRGNKGEVGVTRDQCRVW